MHGPHADGSPKTRYHTQESCGIAAGRFIASVHATGLVSLTHSPSPIDFLAELLLRPANEKAMLVIPVGCKAVDAHVPAIHRNALGEKVRWKK